MTIVNQIGDDHFQIRYAYQGNNYHIAGFESRIEAMEAFARIEKEDMLGDLAALQLEFGEAMVFACVHTEVDDIVDWEKA